MAEFATKGVAGTALGLSIGALAGELLSGDLGSIFGNGGSHNTPVTRYEADLLMQNAELKSEVKFRDANTFVFTEMNKLRDYVDKRFDGVNAQLGSQAVLNAQVTANIACMQGNIATLMGLTKTIVPIDNVCPEPMRQFNSWTAPSTT